MRVPGPVGAALCDVDGLKSVSLGRHSVIVPMSFVFIYCVVG